jgi:hypothetical protein
MRLRRFRAGVAIAALSTVIVCAAAPASAEGLKYESWPCTSWEGHSYTPDYSDVWATTFDTSNCDTVKARAWTNNWTTAGSLASGGNYAVSTVGIVNGYINGAHNAIKGADSYWVYT